MKRYEITGQFGAGYRDELVWHDGNEKWVGRERDDGTRTTFETREEAERALAHVPAEDKADETAQVQIVEYEIDAEE